jgi:hypothetical protein
MATSTQWATSPLDEAAAIVEAEWIRLEREKAQWEREFADLLSELPVPRPSPTHLVVATARRRRGRPPIREDRCRCRARRPPTNLIRATQRSPPPLREPYR